MPNVVRHDICGHNMQWREDWSSASVVSHTIVTTLLLPSSYMVSDEPFPDRSRRANLHKWGLAQSPSWDFLIKPLTLHREQNSVRIIYQRDGITYGNMLHLAQLSSLSSRREELRYDTRCYFNVRSKADISQLNLPHGTDN